MTSLARWTRELRECAATELDAESLHSLRVAATHLVSFCEMTEQREAATALRRLVHATGKARDLDVMASEPQPKQVRKNIAKKRKREAKRLDKAVGAKRVKAILASIAPRPALSAAAVSAWKAKLQRMAATLSHDLRTPAKVHRLRRVLRMLQYSLEWSAAKTGDLKREQQQLGQVMDLAVAVRRSKKLGSTRRARRALRRKLKRALRAVRRTYEHHEAA